MYCTGGTTQQGGRRRRNGKTKKARKPKMMRGGVFYGFNGGVGGTSAGADWKPVANAEVDPVSLQARPESILGGRRRGKGKKATRKSRKSRKSRASRKAMRGGGGVVNSAGAGYGFSDPSFVTTGPATASGYPSRVGGAPMGGDMVAQLPQ